MTLASLEGTLLLYQDPERARQRVGLQAVDDRRLAYEDPCLRTAQQLVPAEAHYICSSPQGRVDGRLIREGREVQQRSAPQIIGDRYTQLSPQFGQVLHPYFLREAQHLE